MSGKCALGTMLDEPCQVWPPNRAYAWEVYWGCHRTVKCGKAFYEWARWMNSIPKCQSDIV